MKHLTSTVSKKSSFSGSRQRAKDSAAAILAAVTLSLSVNAVFAETPKDASASSQSSSASSVSSSTSVSSAPTGLAPAASAPTVSAPAASNATGSSSSMKGDTGSAASIDNFIPGSEVMPAPQTKSDDFVKSQKPSMDLALLLHKNREYKQSLLVLEKLPQNEKTRYYSGLNYKALGNVKAATDQFAWVAYYAKDPQLKSFALAGIRAMRPSKPTKRPKGYCSSDIYSAAQARQRSEEIQARIGAEQRSRYERGELDENNQFRSNWNSASGR